MECKCAYVCMLIEQIVQNGGARGSAAEVPEPCLQDKIMGSRGAQQALTPGRLVLVTNRTNRLQELAVICGSVTKQKNPLLRIATSSEGAAATSQCCSQP